MPSILHIGKDKFLTVDRIWRDNGADAQYALVGGQKILIDKGSRAKPTVCQFGNTFFYMDGTPVTRVEDVEHLSEPFKSTALKFIAKVDSAPAMVETFKSKEEALVASVIPRKRGRPAKPKMPIKSVRDIKDEESYREAGGIVT